jgi:uncharacterized lipoprotein YddW (UPF0748 family)
MRPWLVLACLLAVTLTADARELRGLWVVRTALVSPQAVDDVVDGAHEAGFNALFVQVRGRGDAFYPSQIVSRSVLLERQPETFDPLERLLRRARVRGLEVHAWFNVLLAAHFPTRLPPDHILAQHPEWVMVPKPLAHFGLSADGRTVMRAVREASRNDTDIEGFYLSPAAPGVVAHLEQAVRELVTRYPLGGLHWDFIRYPGPRYDYSRWALDGFRSWRGGGERLAGPEADPKGWATYRRGILTSLATRLGEVARSSRPGIMISAAVVPDEASALHHKFQAWPAWVARGILDAVCPMAYTTNPELFRQQVSQASLRTQARGQLWAGIGAYRLPVDGSIARIETARRAGAEGVVLFSNESLSPTDLRRLRQRAFGGTPAVVAKASGSQEGDGVALQ